MRVLKSLVLALAGLAGACATQQGVEDPAPYADRRLDRFTWSPMERFESESEFRRYLARIERVAEKRGYGWAGLQTQYAAVEDELLCDPKVSDCTATDADDGERIVVTGSRIVAPPFTNTQEAAVDEGDIVKQIGDFLVVLQDGRLFSVALRPEGEEGLELAARTDVYRSSDEDTWYDEMLVFDRRILVTGYSYDEDATELAVLTLADDGSFTREAVFYISSDDYYDVDNYATRIVGDRLVIHTPIYLAGRSPYDPAPWPAVRRWRQEEADGSRGDDRGRPLFDATDIIKPVQRTLQPILHTISVCPLGGVARGRDLDCETTAIVGTEGYTFYVSETDAWLWLYAGYDEGGEIDARDVDCKSAAEGAGFADGAPSVLFRAPLSGREPDALGVRGAPSDQFSLDATRDEFRALLVQWPFDPCIDGMGEQELAYFSTPLSRLDATLRDAPDSFYAPMPSPGGETYENRFTDTHLVYAGRSSWSSYAPYPDEPDQSARMVVAPIGDPEAATVLQVPHGVLRVEQAGAHVVVTGYTDSRGLRVSVADLRGEPRIADTVTLPWRYETEGRSHAFNSRIEADGSGLLGLPTAAAPRESGRWWWRSDQSDVSFLTVDADAQLAPAGELTMNPKGQDPRYECEVSCIDWYGNSRPIFTEGRVFALSGTEVIEGVIVDGRIEEIRRVDLTASTPEVLAMAR